MSVIAICNCCGEHVHFRATDHRSSPGRWYCPTCTVEGNDHRCSFHRPDAPPPREGEMRIRQVRPGLYERVDTPKHVKISGKLLAAIRAESPFLADLLESMEEETSTLPDQPAPSGGGA